MRQRLLQLLRDNATRQASGIRAEAATDSAPAELYLYDVIDPYWGVAATDFNQALAGLKGQPVNLRINSPGGDVFDGRAMAAGIAQHGQVTGIIEGLCASAATTVAMACTSISMAQGSMYMIHNGWTLMMGNKSDLLATAALLGKIDAAIANDYAKKTGLDPAEIAAMMDAETWFTADEALQAGFVTRVFETTTPAPANTWNLAAFANAPQPRAQPQGEAQTEPDYHALRAQAERRLRLLQIA